MTEGEEAEFWSSHSLGQELLDQMEPVPEGCCRRQETCGVNQRTVSVKGSYSAPRSRLGR